MDSTLAPATEQYGAHQRFYRPHQLPTLSGQTTPAAPVLNNRDESAITDVAHRAHFTYSPVDMDLTLNQAMTPNTVSPGGGAVTSWEIEPDVPNGLNFGSSNREPFGARQRFCTDLTQSPTPSGQTTPAAAASPTVTITIIDDRSSRFLIHWMKSLQHLAFQSVHIPIRPTPVERSRRGKFSPDPVTSFPL